MTSSVKVENSSTSTTTLSFDSHHKTVAGTDDNDVSQTLEDISNNSMTSMVTEDKVLLDGSVVVTPTKSVDNNDEDEEDVWMTNENGKTKDMELILSTFKENAMDLALTEQVEHLQSYNTHLLELLQSEKKRCDDLLKRNELLSNEADFAKSTCIEVTEQNKGLQREVHRLTNELREEKLRFDNFSRNHTLSTVVTNNDSSEIKKQQPSNNKKKDPINEILNISETDSLELSATGSSFLLQGPHYVKSSSKQQPSNNNSNADDQVDDGVLNATINVNSTSYYGQSDFILDWMEGAGFVTSSSQINMRSNTVKARSTAHSNGANHGKNSSSSISDDHVDDNDSVDQIEPSRSLLVSPIPLLLSPGAHSTASSSSLLDTSDDLKMFSRDCASIRKKICYQNADMNILLREISRFENLFDNECQKVNKLKKELNECEERMQGEVADLRQRLNVSEIETCEFREKNLDIQYSLKQQEEDMLRLKNSLKEAEEQVEKLTNQLLMEKNRASEKLRTLAEQDILITKYEHKVAQYEKEQNGLKKKVESLVKEISVVKNEANEEIASSNRVSEQESNHLRDSVSNLEVKISNLNHILSETKSSYDLLECDNRLLKANVEESDFARKNLESKLAEKERSIEALDRVTFDLSASLKEAEGSITKLSEEKERLEDEVNKHKSNSDRYQAQLHVLESDYCENMEAKEKNNKEVISLKESLEKKEEKCQIMEEEITHMKAKVEELTKALRQASLIRDEALTKSKKCDNDGLLHRYRGKIEKLEKKNTHLRECVGKLNKKCHDWQNTYATLMSQLADEKEHRKSSATLFEQVTVYKEKLRKAKAIYKKNMTAVTEEMKLIQEQVCRYKRNLSDKPVPLQQIQENCIMDVKRTVKSSRSHYLKDVDSENIQPTSSLSEYV